MKRSFNSVSGIVSAVKRYFGLSLALYAFFVGVAGVVPAAAAEQVVVYSSRKDHLIRPLFEQFEQQTGIEVKYITDKAAPLISRIAVEGKNTAADMLITVDAGNLWQAAEQGLLVKVDSEILNKQIPAHLRDPEGRWYGLSVRARTIVYATDRVKPSELSTYEALGESQWKDRLCLRTSKKVYNQSLVATMIASLGAEKTESYVKSWVANLATPVFSNDTKLMQSISAGQCDVGIVNSYYFGRLQDKDADIPLALYWPNQNDRGVHINISGAGITRHSKNPENALRLLEWLASKKAQGEIAALNKEFPANPNVPPAPQVVSWGTFKADTINVEVAGKLQVDAIKLMDRAGYR